MHLLLQFIPTFDLLLDADLATGKYQSLGGSTLGEQYYLDLQLTWQGHEYLDAIRDPEIWQRTKQGALAAGGFTVEVLKGLAVGLIKKQIEERTGIKL